MDRTLFIKIQESYFLTLTHNLPTINSNQIFQPLVKVNIMYVVRFNIDTCMKNIHALLSMDLQQTYLQLLKF